MTKISKKTLASDFCVVGGGSGGLSFAAGAVQMGASVVLVEHKKMGGDCLNTGCVPSKALLAAAKAGHALKNAAAFGWKGASAKLDCGQVYRHIHEVIDAIAPHDSAERFESLGVTVLPEKGWFADPDTLETGHHFIKAKRYIIATGSHPFIPPVKGLETVPYHTNESIFDLQSLPAHLAIIGGGPIGIEMAQAFVRFGSKVTVMDAFAILPKDDAEMTLLLKNMLAKEGIAFKEHVQIRSVHKKGAAIEVSYTDHNKEAHVLKASHILVAAGRRPNLEGLGLDAAGIEFTPAGIKVDGCLRTTNRRAYALGDCIGGYQFTHVAGYHAGLVIRNSIFRMRTKVITQNIPWVTYTEPELAHVGYTQLQLEQMKIPFTVLKLPFAGNDRAQAERKPEGQIKALISPQGKILGVTVLGTQAGDLIYPWVMAMQNGLKVSALASSIAPYPTLSDLSKRLAGSYYTLKLFSPFMKKMVRFLMRLAR